MRMDHDAHSQGLRLTTCGLDLRIGHGLLAALADARRSKNLDEIRPLLFSLTDELPDLFRRAAVVEKRLERSQNARPWNNSPRDGLTEVLVLFRAGALNGRKTGIECGHRVIHRTEHGVHRRFIASRVTVTVKVVVDVRMRVNPAGHNGEACQVVAARPGRNRTAQPDDLRTLHDDRCIDRKSTRLNSSHPSISYAVFCLKKKKKK